MREGISAEYSATITLDCSGASKIPPQDATGAGWFVGDLHAHSGHSDGSCNNSAGESVACPAFVSAQIAAERELDFVALTEHNAVSGHATHSELQAFFPSTLFLSGREVTTFLAMPMPSAQLSSSTSGSSPQPAMAFTSYKTK